MNYSMYFKNLTPPEGITDIVLDTDAYNEIDDQFAISYMIKRKDKFNVKGICAAPFYNSRSSSPADGMEKSYFEILKLLDLANASQLNDKVYRGSEMYLTDETIPVKSPAAEFISSLAEKYSPEKPLYVVAIGAITNVASALLLKPEIKENIVILWLGGHSLEMPYGAGEFNMTQDIAAARVVFGSKAPLVQLPCVGTVDRLATTEFELRHWLSGKNALCDYLTENTLKYMNTDSSIRPWSKVIWDIAPLFWLCADDGKWYMSDRLCPSPVPEYDNRYAAGASDRHLIKYVFDINRDAIFEKLFEVLAE